MIVMREIEKRIDLTKVLGFQGILNIIPVEVERDDYAQCVNVSKTSVDLYGEYEKVARGHSRENFQVAIFNSSILRSLKDFRGFPEDICTSSLNFAHSVRPMNLFEFTQMTLQNDFRKTWRKSIIVPLNLSLDTGHVLKLTPVLFEDSSIVKRIRGKRPAVKMSGSPTLQFAKIEKFYALKIGQN